MPLWDRGLMAIDVECKFRDRGSIPSACQIMDADLGQVDYFEPPPKRWPPPRLAMRYRGGLHLVYKTNHCTELKENKYGLSYSKKFTRKFFSRVLAKERKSLRINTWALTIAIKILHSTNLYFWKTKRKKQIDLFIYLWTLIEDSLFGSHGEMLSMIVLCGDPSGRLIPHLDTGVVHTTSAY